MGRIFSDSCGDRYDTADYLFSWDQATVGSLAVVSGIAGATGNCLQLQAHQFGATGEGYLRRNLSSSSSEIYCGLRFQTDNLPFSGYYSIFTLWDNTAQTLVSLCYDASGRLSIWSGGTQPFPTAGSSQIGGFSSANAVHPGVWIYLELHVVLAETGGSYNLRANSQSIMSGSGVSTSPNANPASMFAIMSKNTYGAGNHTFDDVYVNDATGTANNSFEGDVSVIDFFPSGAGASTQWSIAGSAPAATNWQSVNKATPGSGTDSFVDTGTTGDKDLYTLPTLPANVMNVTCVSTVLVASTDTTGMGTGAKIAALLGNGATSAAGNDVSLNTSFQTFIEHHGINPLTSAPWTLSDFATLQIGQQRTS